MTEKDFLETVEAICGSSIKLYTATGAFYEAVAFLEGFALGANVGDPYHSRFTPFRKWIVQKFELPELIIDWREFRELFNSDSEALANLPVLYKEYTESSTPYY